MPAPARHHNPKGYYGEKNMKASVVSKPKRRGRKAKSPKGTGCTR